MAYHYSMHRVLGVDLDSNSCGCGVLFAFEVEGSSRDNSDPINVVWYPIEKAYTFPCQKCIELLTHNTTPQISYTAKQCACRWMMHYDVHANYFKGMVIEVCRLHYETKARAIDRWKQDPEIVINIDENGKVMETIMDGDRPVVREVIEW